MTSCDDKLDITPKGMTTLSNVTDLELLLNQEYGVSDGPLSDIGMVCNDGFPAWTDMAELQASPLTLQYAYTRYDESVDRATVTDYDARYSGIYQWIYYCDVVIEKAPDAEGSDAVKQLIVAEARMKRAYLHYLLVNIYAKQYEEATASQMGGVPYVDYIDMSENKVKISVAEVYDKILVDCSDEIIDILPDDAGVYRAGKAFGNAVRAKVLFQMKRYSEAENYALRALKYNSTLDNRSSVSSSSVWELPWDSPNNYFYMRGGARVSLTYTCMTKELAALFSPDDYVRKYEIDTWSSEPTWGDATVLYGYPGGLIYTAFSNVYFNNYGIRTEDMYYLLAETNIRAGKIDDGLNYVDQVQLRRIDGYVPLKGTGLNMAQAMKKMQEAKKVEMYGTYNNFIDCKRWNTEPDYRASITRDLGEYGTFTISPDSPLWVMPFPANATRYNPSLTQNY